MISPEIVKQGFIGYLTIDDELALELSKIMILSKFKKNEIIYKSGDIASSVGVIQKRISSFFYLERRERNDDLVW